MAPAQTFRGFREPQSTNSIGRISLRLRNDSEESDGLRLVVLIVDGVSIGQHALMQDARNENATTLLAVEHDVLSMLMAVQAGANVTTKPP